MSVKINAYGRKIDVNVSGDYFHREYRDLQI